MDIGRPSRSVDAGRKESGMDKIEIVGGEGERPVQVINLCCATSATVLRRPRIGNRLAMQ